MKIDLTKTTFIIPVRIDFKERLDNLKISLKYLTDNFNTNIILFESDKNPKLELLIKKQYPNVQYIFQKTNELLFHRMYYLNIMLNMVVTPVVVNYDVDILLPINSYKFAENKILNEQYDFFHPFTNKPGVYYLEDIDKQELIKNNLDLSKLDLTKIKNDIAGCGFCVFINTNSYRIVGGENINFKAFSPEDNERMYKFYKLGFKTGKFVNQIDLDSVKIQPFTYSPHETDDFNSPVFHLQHPRGINSSEKNKYFLENVFVTFKKLVELSDEEYYKYYCNYSNFDYNWYKNEYNLFLEKPFELYKHYIENNKHVTFPKNHKIKVYMKDIGLNGRLGNQIFQYVLLNIIKIKSNIDVKIPIFKTKDKYKCFELDNIFNINNNIKKLDILENDNNIIFLKEDRNIKNTINHIINFGLENNSKNTKFNLKGYFQDIDYFYGYESYIKKLLSIKPELESESNLYLQNIRENNEVIIGYHIRRTDYLQSYYNNMITPYNYTGTPDYVRYFLKKFNSIFDKFKIVIFSDDIEWCKVNLNIDSRIIFSEGNTYQDFIRLKNCDHIVMSSSSFSWWASFLNDNIDKKIYIPQNWYNLNNLEYRNKIVNLYYKDWIKYI